MNKEESVHQPIDLRVDGVTLVPGPRFAVEAIEGDFVRVLITNQPDPRMNGVYLMPEAVLGEGVASFLRAAKREESGVHGVYTVRVGDWD